MTFRRYLPFALAVAVGAGSATARDFYVDAVNGDDLAGDPGLTFFATKDVPGRTVRFSSR